MKMSFKNFVLVMMGTSLIGISIGFVLGYFFGVFYNNMYLVYISAPIMGVGSAFLIIGAIYNRN